MSEKRAATPTKDNTPARLKIEQEYNDKKNGSGWNRYYKVSVPPYHCTPKEEQLHTGKKQSTSKHAHMHVPYTHMHTHSGAHILFYSFFHSISTKM